MRRLENIKKRERVEGRGALRAANIFTSRGGVEGKALFSFFFFSLFFQLPLVCVTDNSRAALTSAEAREGESAGQLVRLCCPFALYAERDHSRLHGTGSECLEFQQVSRATGHSAPGHESYGRIRTPLPPYCVVVQGRKAIGTGLASD